MRVSKIYMFFYLLLLASFSCESDAQIENPIIETPVIPNPEVPGPLKYLALGDSYTIGESVCATCRFPAQLKDSLAQQITDSGMTLKIIAQTGWTTTNLMTAINNETLPNQYDLVTLLIGVNNQYQNKPFSLYQSEFPQLLSKAILLAKGDKNNVIVVSVPDYAFTPFGQGTGDQAGITSDINQYNSFAQNYCLQQNVEFVNITEITREGLNDPELVASDGLHPSEKAYTRFVERILPKALTALGD